MFSTCYFHQVVDQSPLHHLRSGCDVHSTTAHILSSILKSSNSSGDIRFPDSYSQQRVGTWSRNNLVVQVLLGSSEERMCLTVWHRLVVQYLPSSICLEMWNTSQSSIITGTWDRFIPWKVIIILPVLVNPWVSQSGGKLWDNIPGISKFQFDPLCGS